MAILINPFRFAAAGGPPHWQELARTTLGSNTSTITTSTTATPTLSDDFSGTDDWADSDSSNTGVNTTTDLIDFTIDSSADTTTYDLTTVSNTAWVLRFKVKWLTKNTNTYATFGISDNTSAPNVSQDIISIQWRHEGASKWYGSQDTDGSAPNGVARDNEVSFDPTTSTDYYFEIVRQTATTYIVRRYSDSTYGTVSDSASGTCASTTQTLRYIKFAGWTDCSATSTAEIDDVKFYNDVTAVTTSTFTPKPYMMVLANFNLSAFAGQDDMISMGNGTIDTSSTTQFAYRKSYNGAADSPATSQEHGWSATGGNAAVGENVFYVGNLNNESSQEKIGLLNGVLSNTAGAGNAPDRFETAAKYVNTSNQINIMKVGIGGNTYASGSEFVVLGYDPADTTGGSIWEELDSTTASGSTQNLTSGQFTSKKYLWIQCFVEADSTIDDTGLNFGTGGSIDTGSNYARRFSSAGGTDSASGSQVYMRFAEGTARGGTLLCNAFVINKSDKEKLCIAEVIRNYSSGAGTAPYRFEMVGKWANTSDQIDIVRLRNSLSNNLTSNSFIKVWGFD